MANDNSNPGQPTGDLEKAKQLLASRGLRPIDYKHLGYEGIMKLAGLRP